MFKLVKALVSAAALTVSLSALANTSTTTTTTTSSSVDTACSTEMTTSGCASDSHIGKCFHEYKKKHSDFKVSHDCKAAVKAAHEKK